MKRHLEIITVIILSVISLTEGACVRSQDVAIVLDGSRSMGEGGFWSIKRFAIDMLQLMDVGPVTTYVGLVRFSMEATVVFNFTAFFSSVEMESAINALVYSEGDSGIDEGLEIADKLLRDGSGARPNASKFLVVFSDGDFISYDSDNLINGAHVIAVGGGPRIYQKELKSLVKDKKKDFFTTDNDSAESVVKRINDLTQQDCNGQ